MRKKIFAFAATLMLLGLITGCSSGSMNSEVEPYLDYLGGAAGETVTLPTELYKDIDTVSFLGREGTVSYAQSIGAAFMGDETTDELTWESNDTVTHEEFEAFVNNANGYFGYEAEEEEVLGDPCYRWDETEPGCMVTASYDSGHIKVAWQLN